MYFNEYIYNSPIMEEKTHSGYYSFKNVVKMLEIAIETNNTPAVIELVFEFQDKVAFLKKVLLNIALNIAPNLYLIYNILFRKSKNIFKKLYGCALSLSGFPKTKNHIYAFWVAEMDRNEIIKNRDFYLVLPTKQDALEEISKKTYVFLCCNETREYLRFYMDNYRKYKLNYYDLYKYFRSDYRFLLCLNFLLSKDYRFVKKKNYKTYSNIDKFPYSPYHKISINVIKNFVSIYKEFIKMKEVQNGEKNKIILKYEEKINYEPTAEQYLESNETNIKEIKQKSEQLKKYLEKSLSKYKNKKTTRNNRVSTNNIDKYITMMKEHNNTTDFVTEEKSTEEKSTEEKSTEEKSTEEKSDQQYSQDQQEKFFRELDTIPRSEIVKKVKQYKVFLMHFDLYKTTDPNFFKNHINILKRIELSNIANPIITTKKTTRDDFKIIAKKNFETDSLKLLRVLFLNEKNEYVLKGPFKKESFKNLCLEVSANNIFYVLTKDPFYKTDIFDIDGKLYIGKNVILPYNTNIFSKYRFDIRKHKNNTKCIKYFIKLLFIRNILNTSTLNDDVFSAFYENDSTNIIYYNNNLYSLNNVLLSFVSKKISKNCWNNPYPAENSLHESQNTKPVVIKEDDEKEFIKKLLDNNITYINKLIVSLGRFFKEYNIKRSILHNPNYLFTGFTGYEQKLYITQLVKKIKTLSNTNNWII